MLHRCLKSGFKISEVPITFWERKMGKSKLGWVDVLKFLKAIFLLKNLDAKQYK
jgi:hypothetical protein